MALKSSQGGVFVIRQIFVFCVLCFVRVSNGFGHGLPERGIQGPQGPPIQLDADQILSIVNGPNAFTSDSLNAVEKAVDVFFNKYDLKNFAAVYGNVFTGEKHTYFKGTNQDGSAITADHSFRWASMTKVVGALVAAKALDEGLFKLDDQIKTFLPEFNCSNLKVVTSASWNATSGVLTGTDAPLCDNSMSAATVTSRQITVRQLLNFNVGFAYGFFSWGSMQGLENGLAAYKYILQNYGYGPADAAMVGYDYTASRMSPNADPNPKYPSTFDGLIQYMIDTPLLYVPGTTNTGLSVYGPEMSVFGAYLTKVVQSRKNDPTYNSAKYAIDRIYKPLGIDSTAWFGFGDSVKPSGYDASKMMDVSFVRNTTVFASLKLAVAPGLSATPGIFESTYTAAYGTKNTGSSNSNFNWPNYANTAVFCKDVPGDSMCGFADKIINNSYNASAKYYGMFDGGGVGTWNDYAKILQLYVNKGVYNNTRIIGLAAMRFIQAPQIIGTTSSALGLQVNSGMPAASAAEYAVFVTPAVSSCPMGSPTGMDWSFGSCTADPRTGPVKFPLSTSYYSWVGYFNTAWFVDTETGNYGVYGSQNPKNGQWASLTGRGIMDDIEAAMMSYRQNPIYVPYSNARYANSYAY